MIRFTLFFLFILRIANFAVTDISVLDSLYKDGEYSNLYKYCEHKKDEDAVYKLFYYIGLNHYDRERFIKEIMNENFEERINNNISSTIELEEYNLNKAKEGFNKSVNILYNDFWAKCRLWEIELIETHKIPLFSKSFSEKMLKEKESMDKIEKMICLYGAERKEDFRKILLELSQSKKPRYFFHLANYLISKKDNNFFQMDFEYQNLWKNKTGIKSQFYNYTDRYLYYLIDEKIE